MKKQRMNQRRVRNTSSDILQFTENDIRHQFEKFLRIQQSKGYASRTLNQYRNSFEFFAKWLTNDDRPTDIQRINTETMTDFIVYMQDEHVQFAGMKYRSQEIGLSPTTINIRLKNMRTFYNVMVELGHIDSADNAMTGIRNVKEFGNRVEILTVEEMKRLLGAMELEYRTEHLDYVLTLFLIDSMSRISTALELKESYIDWDSGSVNFPAHVMKSRNDFTVPISDRTMRLLRELISENEYQNPDSYVFQVSTGNAYDRNRYARNLKQYAERCGIKNRVHPHALRHTAATTYLRNGGDVESLRLLMDHADNRMIQRYVHLTKEDIKRKSREFSVINDIHK